MNPDAIVNITLPFMLVGIAALVAWGAVAHQRQKARQAQIEAQTRLLDRLGSGQELLQYLQSEAGQRFLSSATIEHRNPYGQILGGTTSGIVTLVVGLAFLFLRGTLPDPDAVRGLTLLGGILTALGIGFLLSSVAAYVLSKKWGLINGQSNPNADH